MMVEGEQLLDLCRTAQDEILLVAPFVTPPSLERVLGAVSASTAVTLITRWRPDEIAKGFNSLSNRDLILGHAGGRFLLRNDLHAKYYRAGGRSLVGSANLTGAGLGWGLQLSLELLVDVPSNRPNLIEFESQLLRGAVEPDEQLVQHLKEAIDAVEDSVEAVPEYFQYESPEPGESIEQWVPSFTDPGELWRVYRGDFSHVTSGGRTVAAADLRALQLSYGLTQEQFHLTVRSTLEQMPLVLEIARLVKQGRQAHDTILALLKERRGASSVEDVEVARAYRVLLRWFEEFLPGQYEVQDAQLSGTIGIQRDPAEGPGRT